METPKTQRGRGEGSGKVNRAVTEEQVGEVLFYPLPTSTRQCAGYTCLELASNV